MVALVALVALAVLSPWLIGGVLPSMILGLTLIGLAASAVAILWAAVRGGALLPAVPLWPLVGFLGLGLLQLVPLPAALHGLIAPGPQAVWYPDDPAASVLGTGMHPLSLDPDSTLRSLALVAALCLLAVLAAPALARERTAAAAAAVVAAGGFVLAAYAIFARSRFGNLLYGYLPVPTVSPFGPFVSKNHYASWAGMAALLAAGLAFGLARSARARGRDWTAGSRAVGVVLPLVAAVAIALSILASLSRGGVASFAAGATAFVALAWTGERGGGRSRLVASLLLAGGLGAFLLAVVPREAHERLRSLGGASFRLDTWRDAARMALASPAVGHGLGAFHDAYPRYKRGHGLIRVEHAENDYVETLAETGCVGLLLALAGGGLLITRAARGLSAATGPTLRGVAVGAAAGAVALAVHSAADFNLRIPANAALAATLAAVLAAAGGIRPRPLARLACLALAAGALLLAVAALALPREPWRRAREEVALAVAAGSPPARAMRLERAEIVLARVLARRPAHAESWLMLAGARAARGDAAAARDLARHAVSLDPERPSLREAAERLGAP